MAGVVILAVASMILAMEPDGRKIEGRRVALPGGATLILPSESLRSGPIDLVVHLHGAVATIERALDESGWDAAVVVVNEPGLSTAYAVPFRDPERFLSILAEARSALEKAMPGADPDAGRLIVSAFSAGFGGVRELLGQPEAFGQIDALVLADALYCGFEGDPSNRRLDPEKMAGFRRFAVEAAQGRKAMLVSHCALVPDGYASTAETADDLVRHVGGEFESIEHDLGDDWHLSRQFRRGALVVLGFDGDEGDDHLRHLRRLGELWRALPEAP